MLSVCVLLHTRLTVETDLLSAYFKLNCPPDDVSIGALVANPSPTTPMPFISHIKASEHPDWGSQGLYL